MRPVPWLPDTGAHRTAVRSTSRAPARARGDYAHGGGRAPRALRISRWTSAAHPASHSRRVPECFPCPRPSASRVLRRARRRRCPRSAPGPGHARRASATARWIRRSRGRPRRWRETAAQRHSGCPPECPRAARDACALSRRWRPRCALRPHSRRRRAVHRAEPRRVPPSPWPRRSARRCGCRWR